MVQQLQMLSNGWTTTLKVSFITSGSFDAVAVWFDLGIDDIIKISTSPEGESCWDQAIFPVASLLQNSKFFMYLKELVRLITRLIL